MSLLFPKFLVLFFATTAAFGAENAIDPIASINVISTEGNRVAVVRGIFGNKRRPEFSKTFSLAHLPANRRPHQLTLRNDDGLEISFRELADREYLADDVIRTWSYVLDISPADDPRLAAHASWLTGEEGILMLRDLLPVVEPEPRRLILSVPDGWVVSADKLTGTSINPLPHVTGGGDWYSSSSDTVLAIGKSWRKQKLLEGRWPINIAISGTWNFADREVGQVTSEIVLTYKTLFEDSLPVSGVQVLISKFPMPMSPGHWQAETRGNNVTIISSDMPFKTQAVQRLHEQLRHELFHLWIPNDVNLTGNYDWFYEGFALYESLKVAVDLNRITFADFLDTLSRAHTIDSAQSQRVSLIKASTNRFSGSTQVYARGMLVAFLTDLEMLERSKGKRSVEDLLGELYRKHKKPAAPADGNSAVMELFKSNPGLDQIINKFVTGVENIDWTSQLAAAGISDSDPGPITTLKVNEKLNGRQKTLLDKLGYNNWRKLTPVSK